MNSTTVLTSVYSESDFTPVGSNWLTYASVPSADLVALLLTWVLSQTLWLSQYSPATSMHTAPWMLVFYAVFTLGGLYPGIPINPIEEFRMALRAVGLSFLIIIAASFLMGNSVVAPRRFLLVAWVLASVLIPLVRHVVRLWCSRQSWWGIPTVILGEWSAGTRILEVLQSNPHFGLRPIAILVDPLSSENASVPATFNNVLCGDLSHSAAYASRHPNFYAILATPLTGSERVRTIFAEHAYCFRRVLVIPDLFGSTSLAVRAKDVHGILGLEIDHNLGKKSSQMLKRFLDISIGTIAVLLSCPLVLIAALLIKLTSPGPIFYGQTRIGRDGRKFRLWKLRTMVLDAESVLHKHLQSDPLLQAEWNRDHKLKKDPRISEIGRILRRTSLDELPQFWNILCGEMSLVGPRPICQAEIEKYGSIFDQYRRVTPGLTGMWQISGRNNTTYERRIQLDDYYVRNWSTSLDCYILLRTLRTILLTEGAY